MPRYATSGQLGIYWVPTLADTSNPTTVEVAAGVNLAPYLTRDGLKTPTSGNTIDAGIVGTGYSPTVPGTYGGDLIELTLHRGSAVADDTAWATLTRGAPGHLVIARTGWNQNTVTGLGAPTGTPSTGDAVEVYTVTVTSRAMADTAENQTSRFTAQLAIAADPRMDATVMGDTTPTGPAAGDLDGTYPNPTVVATHLAAPLPVSQGGTGSGTAPGALTALGAVATTDARLTDARTPTSHAASHATGGSDPIAPSAIGAETPAGTSTAITTHSGATDPHGDRADAAAKYTPLTDSRLTNARTPTAHASSHATGGTDPISAASIGADTAGAASSAVTTHTAASDPHGDRANAASLYIPLATATTKGDLIIASGAGAVTHLGVAPDGQFLVADSKAANGVHWSRGWRRRNLPDLTSVEALYTGSINTTITMQSTSTISGAQALMAPDTANVTYCGAGSFQYGTGTPDSSYYWSTSRYPNTVGATTGQANYAVELMTDASVIEFKLKYQSTAGAYRLTVDGRKVADLPTAFAGTTVGNSHVLKFDFGSAAPRHLRLDLSGLPFGGIYVPGAATVWRPNTRGGRLGVLGDSITDGSAYSTGSGIGTWLYHTARMLGCTDVWDQSRGGTGYITPGSYATFDTRVALDITPYSFDRLIIWGGYNDSSGSQSAIATAAAALYADIKTGSPNTDITVIGCWSPTGTPATGVTNTDNTLKTAAATAGLPFISPLTGSVYDSAGNLITTQGPWITTANASTYINATDNVHPNDAGHAYLARRILNALTAHMAP